MSYLANSIRSGLGVSASVASTSFVLSAGDDRKLIASVVFEDSGDNNRTIDNVVLAPGTASATTFLRFVPTGADFNIRGTGRARMSQWYADESALPAASTYTVWTNTSAAVERVHLSVAQFDSMDTGPAEASATTTSGTGTPSALTEIITTLTDGATIVCSGYEGTQTNSWSAVTASYTPTELVDVSAGQHRPFLSHGDLATAGAAIFGGLGTGADNMAVIASATAPAAATAAVGVALLHAPIVRIHLVTP